MPANALRYKMEDGRTERLMEKATRLRRDRWGWESKEFAQHESVLAPSISTLVEMACTPRVHVDAMLFRLLKVKLVHSNVQHLSKTTRKTLPAVYQLLDFQKEVWFAHNYVTPHRILLCEVPHQWQTMTAYEPLLPPVPWGPSSKICT